MADERRDWLEVVGWIVVGIARFAQARVESVEHAHRLPGDLVFYRGPPTPVQEPMLPSEATALGMAIEQMEKPAALERQSPGTNQHHVVPGPGTRDQKAELRPRDIAAEAIGMGVELVGYLAGEGMSTRAIAPIVGASQRTVADDLQVSNSAHLPEPAPHPVESITFDPSTGEVIEDAVLHRRHHPRGLS